MKTRIIDILDKMADGTLEDGFKFKYEDEIWKYNKLANCIRSQDNEVDLEYQCYIYDILTDEVEVTEDAKEIEVGEYIRDKEGNIDKITEIHPLFKDIYLYSGTNSYQYSDNAIVNHNKDIIDLIEVGDYINGYKVVKEISREYINNIPKKCLYIISDLERYYENIIFNEDIKTILTKEQYERNCYKLEE